MIQHLGSQWIRPWRVEVFTPLVQVAPPSIQRDGSTRAVHRIDQLRVTSAFDRALYRTRPDLADPHLTEVRTTVAERHVRMLHLDGVSKERLKPGIHAFWATGPVTTVKLVDMRQRAHDVSGQEILPTVFGMVYPERAMTVTTDFEEALHRTIRLVFRQRLGGPKLDQLLAEKGPLT